MHDLPPQRSESCPSGYLSVLQSTSKIVQLKQIPFGFKFPGLVAEKSGNPIP